MVANLYPKVLRWWKLWKVPALAALSLLGAWSIRGPVLRLAAEWRGGRAGEKAQEQADAGRWREAEAEARRALQLDRDDHRALGLLMEASLRNRHPDTLRIAAAYFAHPESSAADRGRVLELLLLARDYIGFRRLQSSLGPEMRREPDIVLPTIRFLSLRGGHAEALRELEAFRAQAGSVDERFDLLAADLQIRASRHGEAAQSIAELVRRGGTTGAAAFRLLDRIPLATLRGLPLDETLAVRESEPPLSTTEALVAAKIRYAKARETETDEIVAAAIAAHREDGLEALCQWLAQIGQGRRVVEIVSKERALASSALAALRLQSHIVAGDLDGAERWLAEIDRVFDAARASATRAVLASRQGRRTEALRHWRGGISEAEVRNDGNLFLRMGMMALEFREWDWAVEAILKASSYPEALLPSGTDLTPLVDFLLEQDRLGEARKLAALWLAREPENPALRNNLVYLELLSGTPAESLLPQSEALATAFPGTIGFQTTHALALALSGDLAEATSLLEHPALEWSRAGASDRLVRELLRLQIDAPDSARALLAAASVHPAERRFLESFLSGRVPTPETSAEKEIDPVRDAR